MMAAGSETYGVFKLNDGTTLNDYSAHITECTIDLEDMVEGYHTLGQRDEKQTIGGRTHKIELTVLHDPGATSLYSILLLMEHNSAFRAFEAYDPDTASGSKKLSGTCVITKIGGVSNAKGGSGKVKTVKVSMATHDTVTRANVT